MATDNIVTLTINVNPVKGQSRSAQKAEVEQTALKMYNLIINNVAFYMREKEEKRLITNLRGKLSKVVDAELNRMARSIQRLAVGIADRSPLTSKGYTNLKGTLAITGPESIGLRGQVGSVSLMSGTGPWPARNAEYLKQNRKRGFGTRWFQRTGALKQYLGKASTYTQAYGPVAVNFTRNSAGAGPNAYRAAVNPSPTGVPGRKTNKVGIGTVSVSVLSRITSDMLNEPGTRQPSPWMTGLFNYLDEDAEKKLLNQPFRYRSFLEHFLSFYLTRAIPNAVFRKLEATVLTLRRNEGEEFSAPST